MGLTAMPRPSIGIVTPSFQSLHWLPLAVASVADQAAPGLTVHHHVQDGGSTDGTAEWLANRQGWAPSQGNGISHACEPDSGMYEAVNRGLDRIPGDILAYLNCDEQYLPGTLLRVADAFAADPNLDLLLADALVIDADGGLICRRHVVVPHPAFVEIDHLPTFTGAMFFRRRVFHDYGLRFDTSLRCVADAAWMVAALRHPLHLRLLRQPTTAFVDDGRNLSLTPEGRREKAALAAQAPPWARRCHALLRIQHQLRKLARGAYLPQRPLTYAIYTRSSPGQRVTFTVQRPPTIWRERL